MSASVAEAINAASDRDPLLSGLAVLSQYEKIPFKQYIRHVLPLDGYVYWLKTKETLIPGSLHVQADKRQNEDETIAIHRVVLTTGEMIQPFSEMGPNTIWVGQSHGLKFAFSQGGPFYRAAGLFHYSGNALYPALESQLVDVGAELSSKELIVSNSLPAWLTLSTYTPIWLLNGNPAITLYPSFLVPDNLRPPYGTVHIEPAETRALGGLPFTGPRWGVHTQLAVDMVTVTLYGTTNTQAAAFLDLVNQYSLDTDTFGIMDATVIRDEKRTQAELGILAMKKTLHFEVDYLQTAMSDAAQQLLLTAPLTFLPATT